MNAEQSAENVRVCIPRHIVVAMIQMARDPRLSAESVVRELDAVLSLELQHSDGLVPPGTMEP